MTPTREELALQIDEAEWDWLRAHLERDGIIVVAHGLDLVDAGLRIAENDTDVVQRWVDAGMLGKPLREQLEEWDADRSRRFMTLIVSPFILVQEIPIARA
jgi:hypothetical protein